SQGRLSLSEDSLENSDEEESSCCWFGCRIGSAVGTDQRAVGICRTTGFAGETLTAAGSDAGGAGGVGEGAGSTGSGGVLRWLHDHGHAEGRSFGIKRCVAIEQRESKSMAGSGGANGFVRPGQHA